MTFKGKHFKKAIILMAIRWYIAYSLSYRDIEELCLERGLKIDHSTVNRWVREYAPQLCDRFKKKQRPVHKSWSMDETYVKVKGKWCYLYRAVDKHGDTIDFYLSSRRDRHTAIAFFKQAFDQHGLPEKVMIDKNGATQIALWMLNYQYPNEKDYEIRQVKYLNNIIEQDHRFIKKITKPMKGFKSFDSAKATLAGVEMYHMIRKGQDRESYFKNSLETYYSLTA